MARPTDTYFSKDQDVLAVYDFEYQSITEFTFEVSKNTDLMFFCIPPMCCCCPCMCCFVNSSMYYDNIEDATKAQHLALTQDGIKYIVEAHKTGCRCDCQDQGKRSKTIPYDKITDCDIEEPAGASGPCCCMTPNVLHKVNVDTASAHIGQHELSLRGLKDAEQFKKDVWSMKRGEGLEYSPNWTGNMPSVIPIAASQTMERPGKSSVTTPIGGAVGMSGPGEVEMIRLMKEQNTLLKKQNKILQGIMDK